MGRCGRMGMWKPGMQRYKTRLDPKSNKKEQEQPAVKIGSEIVAYGKEIKGALREIHPYKSNSQKCDSYVHLHHVIDARF